MKHMEKVLMEMDLRLAVAIFWMIAIFAGSSIPGKDLGFITTPDYILHAGEYAVLGGLLGWWCFFNIGSASHADKPLFPWACLALSVAIGSAYGALDELHQGFVSGRCQDPRDWVSDTIGCLAGAFLVLFYIYWLRKNNGETNTSGP